MNDRELAEFGMTALHLHTLARRHERLGDEYNVCLAKELRRLADTVDATRKNLVRERAVQEAGNVSA